MDSPTLETREGILIATLSGVGSQDHFIKHVRTLLQACKDKGVNRLLIDLTGVFGELELIGRFETTTSLSENWPRQVRVAFLAREDLLDTDRFGILVLQNRGVQAEAFLSFDEAWSWLQNSR